MSTIKYTPGPWQLGEASEAGKYILDDAGERVIAEAFANNQQNFKANADLISAAPEMFDALEAAQAILEFLDDGRMFAETLDQIKAILAKAQGE